MPHVLEPASSGRAKCRGCGVAIKKGELRLGERLPNPFAEGEMTHWYHPVCAAYKRPETFLEVAEDQGLPYEIALLLLAKDRLEHGAIGEPGTPSVRGLKILDELGVQIHPELVSSA